MLENALRACPEGLWSDPAQPVKVWYVVYHTLFWLDLYLSGSLKGFAPPAPFTLDELDPAGLLPERVYSQDEMHAYLEHCREKCRLTLETLTEEKAQRPCEFPWGKVCFAELLLDNMRHVQEHAAQINLILGMTTGSAPDWVSKTGADA
jgi:hypothetical protein